MDRLELLKPLIKFNKDEFVFVQIFQRRKDNPNLELSVKRLKSYSFYSWEELEEQLPRIQEICDLNNARAYIRLNKQNSVDVSLRCISEMTDNVRFGNAHKNKGVWDSVSGKNGSKDWWVLDLDEEHLTAVTTNANDKFISMKESILYDLNEEYQKRENTRMVELIKDLNKKFEEMGVDKSHGYSAEISGTTSYEAIENKTKSGIHIICKPFDTRILDKYNKELGAKQLPTIQIQKDANTIIYIGNEI